MQVYSDRTTGLSGCPMSAAAADGHRCGQNFHAAMKRAWYRNTCVLCWIQSPWHWCEKASLAVARVEKECSVISLGVLSHVYEKYDHKALRNTCFLLWVSGNYSVRTGCFQHPTQSLSAQVPKYSQRLKGSESPPPERPRGRRTSPRPVPQKAAEGFQADSTEAVFSCHVVDISPRLPP